MLASPLSKYKAPYVLRNHYKNFMFGLRTWEKPALHETCTHHTLYIVKLATSDCGFQ